MPILNVGETSIAYTLRRSPAAKRARLTVTPEGVDVVVPEAATEAQVARVLSRRRAWLLSTTQAMGKKASSAPKIIRFSAGAKIPFRGRQMRVRTELADCAVVEVAFRNGFEVRVPSALPADLHQHHIETAVRLWLKSRIRRDVMEIVRLHQSGPGLKPRNIQVCELKHLWGSCGRNRVVAVDWRLVFAPKTVLEYAVVHELAHLRHRNHGPEFWSLVGAILPDWRQRKTWLDQNEHLLTLGA